VTGRRIVSARTAAVALAAAAALAGQAAGAVKTTEPQQIRPMTVLLTNQGIKLSLPSVKRGSLVQFKVRNTSNVRRDFFIAGYLVHALRPGQTKSFQLQFLFRGKYPYRSVAHPGTKFTGAFTVT